MNHPPSERKDIGRNDREKKSHEWLRFKETKKTANVGTVVAIHIGIKLG